MKAGPAEKLNHEYSDQGTKTVKTDVFDSGTSSGNKGLVVFVQSGESYT